MTPKSVRISSGCPLSPDRRFGLSPDWQQEYRWDGPGCGGYTDDSGVFFCGGSSWGFPDSDGNCQVSAHHEHDVMEGPWGVLLDLKGSLGVFLKIWAWIPKTDPGI